MSFQCIIKKPPPLSVLKNCMALVYIVSMPGVLYVCYAKELRADKNVIKCSKNDLEACDNQETKVNLEIYREL